LFGAGNVAGRAFEFNAIRAQIDIDVQAIFEHMEIFIAGAEQGLDVGAEFNIFFHSVLWMPPPAAELGSLSILFKGIGLTAEPGRTRDGIFARR